MLRQPSVSAFTEGFVLPLRNPPEQAARWKSLPRLSTDEDIDGTSSSESALRIVHVIASVDPNVGGPATVVSRLAAAQASKGHDVRIISSLNTERRGAFEQAISAIPGIHRVKFELSEKKASPMTLLSPSFWKQLNTAISQADVVHLHGVWDMILLAAAKVARKHDVPYVLRPCGMLDPWCMSHHGLKKKIGMALAFRKMLEGAAFLHVLNKFESDLIEPLGLSTPRKIVPNGIFPEEIEPKSEADDQEFFKQFPQLKGRRYILFLSRLHYKKGLDLLASAYAKIAFALQDVDLVVAGADEGARASFVAAINKAGLKNRVHMVGPIYGATKFAALRHAEVFCLPSRQEGFSLAVTEALACGVPVAISRDTHFPEAAAARAGIEFDLKVDEIAMSLATLLLSNHEVSGAMGAAGRQLVNESYTWPRIAGMTLKLYQEPPTSAKPAISWTRTRKFAISAVKAACLAIGAWIITGCKSAM